MLTLTRNKINDRKPAKR